MPYPQVVLSTASTRCVEIADAVYTVQVKRTNAMEEVFWDDSWSIDTNTPPDVLGRLPGGHVAWLLKKALPE